LRATEVDTNRITMLEVRAIHVSGTGKATENMATQLPIIERSFPEIRGCRPGTINLTLPYPVVFARCDHRTEPIAWDPRRPGLTEQFDIVRVTVETAPGSSPDPAWIYIPYGSPHRGNLSMHELIARKTLTTKPGNVLLLRIDRDWIEAPPYAPFAGWKIIV
jgi:hypothetical protein